ncbi:hypothetical protein SASPL_122775 [Salvia splendens]|uniref:Agglutinin domain-containing protein n=1 Tax=Salvia splendens TaxID=180675 RepID=A0A8X8ZTB7_SALSN|nr:hypothetical protein SASPL_122775 [Salvia splendens]
MAIPKSIVLGVTEAVTNRYLYCKADGCIGYGGDSVFSPIVSRAINNYFHLRFTCNNKYWQKSKFSHKKQPIEDTTDQSCTLFKPVMTSGEVHFIHVMTGWDVQFNKSSNILYCITEGESVSLGMWDAVALVKMPTHVAFKGYNGMYLRAINRFGARLQFGSNPKIIGPHARTDPNVTDCLAAYIQASAKMQVQELVMNRKIARVKYRMEDARIYDETPFLAGSSTLTNITDQLDTMEVEITYQDQKSYTFSSGISRVITTGVPFIAEGKIETSYEISGLFQWDNTTTITTQVTAVPANSTVTAHYVGTRGTCNIPYSYIL